MRHVERDRTLTARDLAPMLRDPDWRSSHFERVAFPDGTDFTGVDLRDCSFIECRVRNAVLPGHDIGDTAATDYIWSWHTDWTGAVLPSNLSMFHREFITEMFQQIAINHPHRIHTLFAQWIKDNSDTWTGVGTVQRRLALMESGDLPPREWVTQYLEPWPRIQAHAYHAVQLAEHGGPETVAPLTRIRVDPDNGFDFNLTDLPTRDRYLLDQDLSQRMTERKGAPWKVHVYTLEPDCRVISMARKRLGEDDRWDWWPGAWA